MRILVLPEFYTSDDLGGNSQVTMTLAMLRGMQAVEPTFAEFVLPQVEGPMYWDDDLFADPWIRTWPIDENYRNESWDHRPFPVATMLPFRGGKVAYDLVLNMKQLHAVAVKLAITGQPGMWTFWPEVPVVTLNTNMPIDPRLPAVRSRAGRAGMIADALVGPVLVQGNAEVEAYRKILSPVLTEAEHTTVDVQMLRAAFDPPADSDRNAVEEARRQRRASDPTIVAFHGGSFEAKRHKVQLAEMVASYARAKLPVRCTLKTQASTAAGRDLHGAEIEFNVGHARYVESLVEGDVFLYADDYPGDGGTGLAFMEGVASGMLPVVMKGAQQEARLPAGYPLIAKDWEQMGAALTLAVLSHDQLKAEWGSKLIAHLRAEFSAEAVGARFAALAQGYTLASRTMNKRSARGKQPFFDLVAQAVEEEGWTEITDVADVRKAVSKRSRSGGTFHNLTPVLVRWMLMNLGYKDRCDRPGLSMQKESEVADQEKTEETTVEKTTVEKTTDDGNEAKTVADIDANVTVKTDDDGE